jgi:hypothetical protein
MFWSHANHVMTGRLAWLILVHWLMWHRYWALPAPHGEQHPAANSIRGLPQHCRPGGTRAGERHTPGEGVGRHLEVDMGLTLST